MNHGFDIRTVEMQRLANLDIKRRSKEKFIPFRASSKGLDVPGASTCDPEAAVLWAVDKWDHAALKLLLERGYDPFPIKYRVPAADLAAKANKWDIVEILLQYGKQGDVVLGTEGLIQKAAASNQCNLIMMNMDLGADIDSTQSILAGEWTALHFAVSNFQMEATTLLLKYGADVNKKTVRYPSLTRDSALTLLIRYACREETKKN
jgi:ankyrin repeat protein